MNLHVTDAQTLETREIVDVKTRRLDGEWKESQDGLMRVESLKQAMKEPENDK